MTKSNISKAIPLLLLVAFAAAFVAGTAHAENNSGVAYGTATIDLALR